MRTRTAAFRGTTEHFVQTFCTLSVLHFLCFFCATARNFFQYTPTIAALTLVVLQSSVTARIDQVLILGNYTLCTWFSCSAGGFTVILDSVLVTGLAGLEVGPGGRLRAEEIGMDVTFSSIAMDFKNLGLMMSMFQVREIQAPGDAVASHRANWWSPNEDFT